MLRQFILLLLFCTVGVTAVEASAMSILKGEKVCIASGFEGRLTFEGKPAAGAKIVRKIFWRKAGGDAEEVNTDKDGRFQFPSCWDNLKQVLPQQFVVQQSIFVQYKGNETQIWETGKMEKTEFSEFGGEKPQNFRCELTDSEIRGVPLEVGFVATTCFWEQGE